MRCLLRSLLFFLLLPNHLPLWAGDSIVIIQQKPLQPDVCVTLSKSEIDAFRKRGLSNADSLLGLYLVTNGVVANIPVAGAYLLREHQLCFAPFYQLGHNLEFEVQFRRVGKLIERKRFHTPAHPLAATPAKALLIYPIADTIPLNALYFHIRFSEPMRQDATAFKFVNVYDDLGNEIKNPWRQKSFWLDEGKLLVLMVHPGRVKTGIHYEGPLFHSGKYYHIKVSGEMLDYNGSQIKNQLTKTYRVIGEDRQIPKVKIDAPTHSLSNSLQSVSFSFSEGMDNASVLDGTRVLDAHNNIIPCEIREKEGSDKIFTVTPKKKWRKGNYSITLNGSVYDFAGNRLNRPFEITEQSQIEKDEKITVLQFYAQ